MEITALFCDGAVSSDDGKLDIHGMFNELYAPDFPARQDSMTLVSVVQWDREDAGDHGFRIDLTHPDGQAVFTVDGHTEVDARPETRPPAKTCLILPMEKVVFPSPGRYRVKTHIKNQTFDGPSLYLMKTTRETGS